MGLFQCAVTKLNLRMPDCSSQLDAKHHDAGID